MLRNNEAQRASLLQSLSPVMTWDIFFNEAVASLKKSHAVNTVLFYADLGAFGKELDHGGNDGILHI